VAGVRETDSPTSAMRREGETALALQRSFGAYAAVVNDLIALRGKTTVEEYNRVRSFLAEARNVRDAARRALEQHKREHGC